MEVSATSTVNHQPVSNTESFSRVKQLFLELSNALAAGDVAAAKEAFTALQKNAPAAPVAESNPIAAKLKVVGQALEAGDVKVAQTALREVNQMLAQRPAGSAKPRGPSGPPPGGGAGKPINASSSSASANKVYDPKDANQDGTVSWKEEQDYGLKHPETNTPASNPGKTPSTAAAFDMLA